MLKDDSLIYLSGVGNVAQFFSLAPSLELRHYRLRHPIADEDGDVAGLVDALLRVSGSVNIRTFDRFGSKSTPFFYGLRDSGQVLDRLREMAAAGWYQIVNETVSVLDGGVSGVAFEETVEIVHGSTPRGVENGDSLTLDRNAFSRLIEAIYGFVPALPVAPGKRVEFSIHPAPVGVLGERQILWEIADTSLASAPETTSFESIRWPNSVSRAMGDKAFGLLVAHLAGVPVPRGTVIPRKMPPFSLGSSTGTGQVWLRTCPAERTPGHFPTLRSWIDPFKLMQDCDPEGIVSSVLAQEGVQAAFSGAAKSSSTGREIVLEGVKGFGDDFMLGIEGPERLTSMVERRVRFLVGELVRVLGCDVAIEWVDDGTTCWVLQVHVEAASGNSVWEVATLSMVILKAQSSGNPVRLLRPVGFTSHVGELLAGAGVRVVLKKAPTATGESD